MNLHKVVIVGRPNVGKSSLFNRILKRQAAVVTNKEGVTRDLHYRNVTWNDKVFELIDTGGFMLNTGNPLDEQVRGQIVVALGEADLILFMADGKTGITDLDLKFSRLVHKLQKPVMLLINKTEKTVEQQGIHEFWKLGMGEPVPISATNGMGVPNMLDAIVKTIPAFHRKVKDDTFLRLSILGRPNSGKSTLVNRMMGEEKLIVSSVAGTTRDAIDLPLEYKGKKIIITDTAGLRKKTKVKEDIEYYSNMRAIESIRRSDICLVLIDSERGLENQDLKIIEFIQELGKGLLLGLNKWDLMEPETKVYDKFVKSLDEKAPQLKFIPKISISGLTGKRVTKIMDEVIQIRMNMQKILGRDNVIEFFRATIEKKTSSTFFQRQN